jgi:hypothetical protein
MYLMDAPGGKKVCALFCINAALPILSWSRRLHVIGEEKKRNQNKSKAFQSWQRLFVTPSIASLL